MKIVKCDIDQLDKVTEFYDKVTAYLEQNINYPKWTHGIYPGRQSIERAIALNVQYICLENDQIVGAFIFNNDPQGDYEKGDWKAQLNLGEYMVIHTLAVAPEIYQKGIGRFMVDYCITIAGNTGYKAVRLDVVPDNTPARKLYEKMGFFFAGEKDLGRNIQEIPRFSLYEFNFD